MYKVFPANIYIKDFIDKKTSDEDFSKLLDILEFMPNTRPLLGRNKI